MKCRIMEIGERDGEWNNRYLFSGLEGEIFEDSFFFRYDEQTGWAKGYFDCDKEIGVTFPVFFSEVRIKKI